MRIETRRKRSLGMYRTSPRLKKAAKGRPGQGGEVGGIGTFPFSAGVPK